MMKVSSGGGWHLAWLAVTAVTACTPYANVPRTKPAEVNLAGVKSVSVYEIEGEEGAMLGGELEEALMRSDRFQLLERGHVDKLLLEKNMSLSGALQRKTKLLPASAFILGTAARPVYDEVVTSNVVGCGKKGKEQCIELTREGRMTYQASLKVVSAETGSVVATKTLTCVKHRSYSAIGGLPVPIDEQSMRLECRGQTVGDFMRMIAPYTVQESVALFKHGELPDLQLANDYLQRGDTVTAIEIYQRVVTQVSTRLDLPPKVHAGAHYVLGVAYALSGDYDRGLELIQRAMTIQPSPSFIDMEFRIKGWRADAAEVEAQRLAAEAQPVASGQAVRTR